MISLLSHPASPIFLGALLIFLLRDKSNIISIISLVLSLIVLLVVSDNNEITYVYNDIVLQYFSYSKLGFIFCLVFILIAIIGKMFSIYRDNHTEKALILIYISSAISVIFSGDFISLYIFWEIMAISSTFVIWSSNNINSIAAGFRYLYVHLFGGMILLIGIIGLYTYTNNLEIRLLDLNNWYNWAILIGLLLNAGAPPFSSWISDAYPEGSYSSSVFLSAYTTKTSVFVLIVTFAGSEILIYVGLYMIIYGIIYALLENDIRRILSYSIVNQVGFMMVGIGIGTELSINGTTAHAFAHIIYKALLLMSAGSVIYMINKRKCTDVGGLYKVMPITTICGIIGALAISAFPLTSGFISKSLILDSSYQQGLSFVWFMLLVGSAGVFLHAGIKFPWFVFFHKSKNIITTDPPKYMKYAMILASTLCILIGVMPELLYSLLPYQVDFMPYTNNHVISQLHLLLFSGLAFFVSLKYLERTQTISLDTDYLYRNKNKMLVYIFNILVRPLNYLKSLYINLGFTNKVFPFEKLLIKQESITNMITVVLIMLVTVLILNIS